LNILNKSRPFFIFMLTSYIIYNLRRLSIRCDNFNILSHFNNIDDPRKYNIRHNFIDIITIAICAIISGAQSWIDVEQYGKSKYDWLKQFLQLPNAIPSHDTFGRGFSLLDPKQFNDTFTCWWQSIQTLIHKKICN